MFKKDRHPAPILLDGSDFLARDDLARAALGTDGCRMDFADVAAGQQALVARLTFEKFPGQVEDISPPAAQDLGGVDPVVRSNTGVRVDALRQVRPVALLSVLEMTTYLKGMVE